MYFLPMSFNFGDFPSTLERIYEREHCWRIATKLHTSYSPGDRSEILEKKTRKKLIELSVLSESFVLCTADPKPAFGKSNAVQISGETTVELLYCISPDCQRNSSMNEIERACRLQSSLLQCFDVGRCRKSMYLQVRKALSPTLPPQLPSSHFVFLTVLFDTFSGH